MGRIWIAALVVCCCFTYTTAAYNNNNRRLHRVSLNELRQVIRDDLVGVVENALVSMEMGRTASGAMRIDEKITTSVEATVRTMTNSIQETLRRFETRLMTIEARLDGSDEPLARSRSRQDFACNEAHERSLQQGVERITNILGSVTERVAEARDASSAAEQGVTRLNERLPAAENSIKQELEHSVGVIETGVKRQLQALALAAPRAPEPAACPGQDLTATLKRMESALTWQMNKVENAVTVLQTGAERQQGRREVDRDAAHQVEPLERSPETLKSCAELLERGFTDNGLYYIRPAPGLAKVRVFCDMTTKGGGWTVFQRRGPHLKRENFFQDWDAYKTGFGGPEGEYWLGNAYLHALTAPGRHRLRVEMLDWNGARTFAEYADFSVADEDDKFRIRLGTFSGDSGDSMTMDNNRQFSTRDQDNDVLRYGNCARAHKAGWWFGACRRANLNGVAHEGRHDGPDGINWLDWKGPNYSIKATRMMVK